MRHNRGFEVAAPDVTIITPWTAEWHLTAFALLDHEESREAMMFLSAMRRLGVQNVEACFI